VSERFELEGIVPNRTTKGPFCRWRREALWNQGRRAIGLRLRTATGYHNRWSIMERRRQ